jgi:patatin-like phospholipase/acyl hydrolase
MVKTLQEHFSSDNCPKRILSLDGGGIKGCLTLGFLKKIESIVREKEGNPNLLLCDYFDLIGGTSTGSIIAASLAIGKSVDQITDLYFDLGGKVFGYKRSWKKPWETLKYYNKGKYNSKNLEKSLNIVFGDITFSSNKIKTGLCIFAKHVNATSPFPIHNHPDSKYFKYNAEMPLQWAIRASSAAPTFFEMPKHYAGGEMQSNIIDGGVSMANNPALELLGLATLKGNSFNWKMNEDSLTIVSVGTGYSYRGHKDVKPNLRFWAENLPQMFMDECNSHNQFILQWLSNSPTAKTFDIEIGDLKDEYLGGKPLIKYLRYDWGLNQHDLESLNLNLTKSECEKLREMDNSENSKLLFDIGLRASKIVDPNHF